MIPPVQQGSARDSRGTRLLAHRFGGVLLFGLVFAGIALATRVALLVKAAPEVTWDASLLAAFAWGALFDVAAAGLVAAPMMVLLAVLPARWFERRWARGLAWVAGFAAVYLLLFTAVAEWTFWDEFGVRFNFIAVDYLVYTTEVIGNIRESYNLPVLLGAVAAGTVLVLGLAARSGGPQAWLGAAPVGAGRRWGLAAAGLAVVITLGAALQEDRLPAFRNNYNRELAKNGVWSLFAAFRNNVLDYEQFYRTRPERVAFDRLRRELVEDGSILLSPDESDTLRYVRNPGPAQRPNVIQITVESLSADFLGIFNPASALTPELDALAARSLVFENFYATGTRTDRGMEALTLSLPPTPGRSMVKRPRNEDMFTLGSVFRSQGYDTAFIYGGFGYFDNMNHYFGQNGYRVIDRNSVAPADVTFANVWGACDGDLFRWTLREADTSAASGRPFHHFVMTTSNHRPYTYPAGKIDLPSKVSGRAGAVKYTDQAIGEFLREAATKPWYKDTVFVIVADHCASSAGKTELPVENYHIPLIIFAPGGQIAPGRIKTLTSQMDYAPTLLGLLNWSYPSRFFGHDVRKIDPADAHALIGNYQKLGHLERGELIVLGPQHDAKTYRYDSHGGAQVPTAPSAYAEDEAISYYQSASILYRRGQYRSVKPDEQLRLAARLVPAARVAVQSPLSNP
ncbi:LTA synthase family protein [Lacunisphaera limnophila]|uniref:LTA synthase family protein n=1 Tax=Lacunisphaera limnophila TaxID=1838286 RepID=UPI00085987FE|nr:alkaline phosphatase family protein [Lacunisphaera limnophila]